MNDLRVGDIVTIQIHAEIDFVNPIDGSYSLHATAEDGHRYPVSYLPGNAYEIVDVKRREPQDADFVVGNSLEVHGGNDTWYYVKQGAGWLLLNPAVTPATVDWEIVKAWLLKADSWKVIG